MTNKVLTYVLGKEIIRWGRGEMRTWLMVQIISVLLAMFFFYSVFQNRINSRWGLL
jgi:hypothetical protein